MRICVQYFFLIELRILPELVVQFARRHQPNFASAPFDFRIRKRLKDLNNAANLSERDLAGTLFPL
jgi:hypothetical protein